MERHLLAHTTARPNSVRWRRFTAGLLAFFAMAMGPLLSTARAQADRSIPSLGYTSVFSEFNDGDYNDALRHFRSESRGAIRTINRRWIDSICYETMLGECYYHMGELTQALDHYTAAVQLYTLYPDWMRWVRYPAAIQPSASVTRVPWGSSTRGARVGRFSDAMLIGQGRIDVNQQIREGGVVQQAHFRSVRVTEILRCTTLAIRRRAQLLGPIRRHDALTDDLVAKLSTRPGPPNHWSEAWIDVQLGAALMAAGKEDQALLHLQRSLAVAGQYDHPLTSTALMELGRHALMAGNYPAALKYFEEATYTAVHFPDAGILEDAFRGAALAYLLDNRQGVYPRLAPAADWAKIKRLRKLRATLLLLQAESLAVSRQTSRASALLQEGHLTMARHDMRNGRIGAQWNYLTALTAFQQGKVADGNDALAAAMDYMRKGSYWVHHIGLADRLYTSGAVRARTAMDLYGNVLRDPQPADWASDPMEAMAVLFTPHPGPMERWFEVALERKAHEKALEIADRARRHRFFSSLAFGGRLQSLRWILDAPLARLSPQMQLLRRDLLARYPDLAELNQEAKAISARLRAAPLVAEDQDAFRRQDVDLEKLWAVSGQQEAILRQVALQREAAELVFPPLRTTKEIQQSLPDGHAVLAFFSTSKHLYAFLMNNKDYTYWRVGAPEALWQQVGSMLREMGHLQANNELTLKDLENAQWKQSAKAVLDLLLKGSRADLTQTFEELVIVPDGIIWYVPFEALQLQVDGKLRPLITRTRIRYAPTVSLATALTAPGNPAGNTAVLAGRLFPRDDPAVAQGEAKRLADALPGTVTLKTPLPSVSAAYASLFDRLVVLDDLTLDRNAYDWMPLPTDRRTPGNSLSDWLALPWEGPDVVILPGFHTAAEDSLKGLDRATAGDQMFLAVCGLMSSGVRTMLLSRWRTGGQSSFDLVREFAQELPHESPAKAWRRAVFLTAGSPLNLDAEPRIRRVSADDPVRGNHPFFWAGYLLIDPGMGPAAAQAEPAERPVDPVVEVDGVQ